MLRILKALFLDKRARAALRPRPAAAARGCAPKRVSRAERDAGPEGDAGTRDSATALAEAEARMAALPPEKAQLIRNALLVHRATREQALAELSDEDRAKLQGIAMKALLGGGK
jgi:hypothetical protein